MVGTDGYAPSTPRMSIEYSTIELSSHNSELLHNLIKFQKKLSVISMTRKV